MTKTVLPTKVRLLAPILRRLRPARLAEFLKSIASIQRVLALSENLNFEVDPISHFGERLIQDGVYEPVIVSGLRRFVHPGGVFVDLGANEGYFSIIAGKIAGPNGRVLAIEPQSRLQGTIRKNIELNALENVDLVQAAISDQEGSVTLYLSPDLNTGSSGLNGSTRLGSKQESVRVTTLDQLFSENAIDRVDFLKMDIEGFEYEAILGSADLFKSGRIRAMTIDWHDEPMRLRGKDPEQLSLALRDFGYEKEVVDGLLVYIHMSSG